MKRVFYIFIFFTCFTKLKAQDPHFSQFFASPLTLNPANTGNFNGDLRVSGNYRNQWPGFGNAYITSTLAVDGSFFKKTVPKADKLSGGLLLLSDQTGNGILKENHLVVSLAYQKGLDAEGHQSITVGFQGGAGNYLFDANKANFEDEISAGGFTIPSSDILLTRDLSKLFFDVHVGLLYKLNFDNSSGLYVGGSVYHLAKPNFGFNSTNYILRNRYNLQGGGFNQLSFSTALHYSFQYQKQFNYREFLVGAAVSRMIIDELNTYSELYAGVWMRNNDSFIPYLGIEWNSVRAGFSYDFNYSAKKAASGLFQTAEVSLSWILANSLNVSGIKCPKF